MQPDTLCWFRGGGRGIRRGPEGAGREMISLTNWLVYLRGPPPLLHPVIFPPILHLKIRNFPFQEPSTTTAATAQQPQPQQQTNSLLPAEVGSSLFFC